jgi:hypothetical protein
MHYQRIDAAALIEAICADPNGYVAQVRADAVARPQVAHRDTRRGLRMRLSRSTRP